MAGVINSEVSRNPASDAKFLASSCDYSPELKNPHFAAIKARQAIKRHETCQGRVETISLHDRSKVDISKSSPTHNRSSSPPKPPAFRFDVDRRRPFETPVLPATSSDFAELFPSSRKLYISHDHSDFDESLNLRITTAVTVPNGQIRHLSLFHLRMYDLQRREFSLRRYARDSGREICHTLCKQLPVEAGRRPALQRSLSSAFASFRSKTEVKALSVNRRDSGYDSMHSTDDVVQSPCITPNSPPVSPSSPDVVKLTFSNYSQIELRGSGQDSSKRYGFEYWGNKYIWRRVVRSRSSVQVVRYQLRMRHSDHVLAEINLLSNTSEESQEEQARGGWVPSCSMSLTDEGLLHGPTDFSDIVVATGLLTLVDDTIRRKFSPRPAKKLVITIPLLSPFRAKLDYMSPQRYNHIVA